ncbi:MAG: A/G-specific adenine glycosylase [Alphaproteobacteria bacterium]|nr:A/G-specific adenine glycosylase [Alphaproteobacteria bacterium]
MKKVVKWYKEFYTPLPWRVSPGNAHDPYKVWVSEVMLQQTTVAFVQDYYVRFMERFPTLQELALASREDVLYMWRGLGYYRRAHNLHMAAQEVMEQYGGELPRCARDLKALSGIGEYTAGAVMSIAWQKPAVALDTNVKRIMARVYGYDSENVRDVKQILEETQWSVPPGDFYQGLMDIGRLFCKKAQPDCDLCPLKEMCVFFQEGMDVPKVVIQNRKEKSACFFVLRKEESIFLVQGVPEGKMLQGMYILPSTEWLSNKQFQAVRSAWPVFLQEQTQHSFKHVFSHFCLNVYVAQSLEKFSGLYTKGVWCAKLDRSRLPLSSLAQKIIEVSDQMTVLCAKGQFQNGLSPLKRAPA